MTTDLDSQMAILKREVDALQIEVMASVRPWYKQVSSLVALAALVFSLGTTAVSYLRTAQQDLLASRFELRNLVEKLTGIPEAHAQMEKDYRDDPQLTAELSASINNRNLVLARQSVATIDRIEGSGFGRGSVLAVEYAAVATALANSFQLEDAETYHLEASKRATDPASAAGALRSGAGLALARGDADSMRNLMGNARAIFENGPFRSTAQVTQDVTNAHTEIQWAQAELQVGQCDLARTYATNAEPLVLRVPEGSMRVRLVALLASLNSALGRC